MEEKEIELDPELWSRLPTELLEKVLARLPLTSLLTFRVVCKRWKSLIVGPRFSYEGSPGKPIIFYHHLGGSLHLQWNHQGVKLPPCLFFPDAADESWRPEHIPFCCGKKIQLVAADGGLLCFSFDRKPDAFIIYNPLAKRWREVELPSSVLPRLPRASVFEEPFKCMLVGLAVNRETGSYSLLVAGIHEESPRDALMYDSTTRNWKRCASVPPLKTFWIDGVWSSERSFCSGGNLYWLAYESNNLNDELKALLKYYVEKDEWAVAQERVPCDISDFSIVAHGGNIFMLDWFSSDKFQVSSSDLQSLGPEVKQLLHEDHQELTDVIYETSDGTHSLLSCLAEGECLYTVHESYDREEFEKGYHKVAEYNSRTSTLTLLPPVLFIPSAGRSGRFWAFSPSLRAYV